MKRRYSNILKVLLLVAIVVVIVVANVSHRNTAIKDVADITRPTICKATSAL